MKKAALLMLIVLAACDGEPPHYALCTDVDMAGWRLISTARDNDGYLVSCTYQSPDGKTAYTDQCTKSGCS